MHKRAALLIIVLLNLNCILSYGYPQGTHEVIIAKAPHVRSDLLKNIAPIIEKSIAEGNYPGAVVLAAHQGHIIYRGVFGNRRVLPNLAPMRFDTIFDIASLTKVMATTPAIMQLVEKGKLDLDAPVAKYWPGFTNKEQVTIRTLLTHTSGLPADIVAAQKNKAGIIAQIEKAKLKYPPGTAFLYSDVNFIVLARIVELVSGEPFDRYVHTHIFKPLGMAQTSFTPAVSLRGRIAPTEIIDRSLRWGQVHDPLAFSMGGVAGNAGLFSTAHDIGIYAQCLLDGGRLPHRKNAKMSHILGPLAILKMITPQTPAEISNTRGLGWDIDSRYSNRGVLFPVTSFGHTGWTGVSLWIDPASQTWIIVLTSRTHPVSKSSNRVAQDRRMIANIISASITDITYYRHSNTGQGELARAYALK